MEKVVQFRKKETKKPQMDVQLFNFKGNKVTVVMKDGNPWWVAKEVCGVLGLTNTTEALRSLDDDEKAEFRIPEVRSDGVRQHRNYVIINEPGLYSLILRSRVPKAKAFKRWVTHEVLSKIRKTGGYMLARPEDTREQVIARALIMADEALKEAQARIDVLVLNADKWITFLRHTNLRGPRGHTGAQPAFI